MTAAEEHVERMWQEELEAAAACQAGDCRYGECAPRATVSEYRVVIAPPCEHDHVCLGYAGVKHIEHGVTLMRYRLCQRHKAWWKTMQEKIRKARADRDRNERRNRTRPKKWSEE